MATAKFYGENTADPLIDRASTEYPPASTFMPVTALAGMAAKISPNKTWSCVGGVNYGGRIMKCTGSHGPLNATDALKKSCNCYFYQFANEAGLETVGKTAHALGLGAPLPSYLLNDSGVISDAAWFAKHYPGQQLDKSSGQLANISIGQGNIKATPLQMAWVAAQIAKSGKAMRPHILHGPGDPLDLSDSGLPPESFQPVRKGMEMVVNHAGGTGNRAKSDRFWIAGKTGTAQVYRLEKNENSTSQKEPNFIVWFIGYAPADNPKYAFAVMAETGGSSGSGGRIAAPIARQIMEEAMSPLPKPEVIQLLTHATVFATLLALPGLNLAKDDGADPGSQAPAVGLQAAEVEVDLEEQVVGDLVGGIVATDPAADPATYPRAVVADEGSPACRVVRCSQELPEERRTVIQWHGHLLDEYTPHFSQTGHREVASRFQCPFNAIVACTTRTGIPQDVFA